MVGYNRGSGGGSGGGDSDYTKDTMTPQTGLKGFTFHAGRSKKQQMGEIPTFDGILQIGNAGTEKHTITPSLEKRYIGKGVYLSQDIEIKPMSRGGLTLSFDDDAGSVRVYPSTNGYVDSSSSKTFSLGGRSLPKFYAETWVPSWLDNEKTISNLSFTPTNAALFCNKTISSSDLEDVYEDYDNRYPDGFCVCYMLLGDEEYVYGSEKWYDADADEKDTDVDWFDNNGRLFRIFFGSDYVTFKYGENDEDGWGYSFLCDATYHIIIW